MHTSMEMLHTSWLGIKISKNIRYIFKRVHYFVLQGCRMNNLIINIYNPFRFLNNYMSAGGARGWNEGSKENWKSRKGTWPKNNRHKSISNKVWVHKKLQLILFRIKKKFFLYNEQNCKNPVSIIFSIYVQY